MSDGHPIEWQIAGNLQVDITGKNSASGAVAVKSNGAGDVIYQFVAVKPGESYRATSQARGDKNDQTGKLQINWLDAQGRLLKEEIELIRADTKWKQFVRICVAPTEASTAVIYLDSLDRDSIWFDDISFGHIRAQP